MEAGASPSNSLEMFDLKGRSVLSSIRQKVGLLDKASRHSPILSGDRTSGGQSPLKAAKVRSGHNGRTEPASDCRSSV